MPIKNDCGRGNRENREIREKTDLIEDRKKIEMGWATGEAGRRDG
jgi:hypothetical protein